MVDREVDGQHVFLLLFFFDVFDGRSIVKLAGLCEWSQVPLGASVCGPGPLLGPVLSVLGPMLAVFSCSWACTGGPVLLLEPMCPKHTKKIATLKMCSFLQRERDLRPRGRSWATLRPPVGSLRRLWGLCWRPRVVLGPKRSVWALSGRS